MLVGEESVSERLPTQMLSATRESEAGRGNVVVEHSWKRSLPDFSVLSKLPARLFIEFDSDAAPKLWAPTSRLSDFTPSHQAPPPAGLLRGLGPHGSSAPTAPHPVPPGCLFLPCFLPGRHLLRASGDHPSR